MRVQKGVITHTGLWWGSFDLTLLKYNLGHGGERCRPLSGQQRLDLIILSLAVGVVTALRRDGAAVEILCPEVIGRLYGCKY